MPQETGYSASMNRLIDRFASLPGIGRRTAERLAFHVLRTSKEEAIALASAISDVKRNVRHCSICYNLTESDPCSICSDPERDRSQILVVEQPNDVIRFEQTHSYNGLYHVLLGHLSPLEGIGPGELTVDALIERVNISPEAGPDTDANGGGLVGGQVGGVEIILGTNPNMEGDGTALLLAERLEPIPNVRVTCLARGLPAGTQLEYTNKAVLSDAIASRQTM